MFWRVSLIAVLAVFASVAHAEQGVTDTEILLGEVEPLSGPPALLGVAYNVGTKVAIAEANAAGGVNGRKLRLIAEDDGYVAARAVQAFRKLVEVDKVFALTSLSASHGVAALPVVEKSGIPTMASIAPVNALYSPPRKNVFVIGQSYEEGTAGLVTYLAAKYPGKKWGVITQDDDYGMTVKAGFAAAAKRNNINVVYDAEYKKGQQDFSSEMLALRSAGVEVFLMGGIISENGAMMRELEKLKAKPVVGIMWPGRLEATLKLMGPQSDGTYAVDYVVADQSQAVKAFLERAKSLLSEAEVKAVNRYSLVGYASGRVLIEAMRRCGKDLTWACAIKELESTKGAETGVMGPVTFGPGVRFSAQGLRIMEADFASLKFRPVP
ncbi:ABC transporter substrate-binding protein [Magnetospirillum sp. 15-1]|uniref:ABC transporter substrate-binding protein n=1 Tax=Magnetospirillum sp. 15-1 TaxID=1979370 RepID=UPI000BBBBFFD|nr:ABC transporter substrate-binding protein [Magnetospirillum sp. 15-1]